MEAINFLAIHHSAVNADSSALTIAKYHVDVMDWPGIAYHWLIHPDGRIEYVGPMKTQRWNVATRNLEVVGICLVGDFTSKAPTAAQLRSARALCLWLHDFLPNSPEVKGHYELAVPGWETSCPGKTFNLWKPVLL